MIDGNLPRSRSLAACSLEAGYAFVLAITKADDQGRLDGDPALLRADLFPRRNDVSDDQIALWLGELVAEGCLHRYSGTDGDEYLHFPAWQSYQRLRKPGEERRPDPEAHCEACRENEARTGGPENPLVTKACEKCGRDMAFNPGSPGREPRFCGNACRVSSHRADKNEARIEKREARGKSRNSPQVAASCRISPQIVTKKEKSKKDKYLVPDSLTDEQMITVKKFVSEKYPEMIDHVEMLTNQCLRHHRSTNNKSRYVRWVSVVETWIERQATQFGGINGATGNSNQGRDDGPLGRIFRDQVARSRGG